MRPRRSILSEAMDARRNVANLARSITVNSKQTLTHIRCCGSCLVAEVIRSFSFLCTDFERWRFSNFRSYNSKLRAFNYCLKNTRGFCNKNVCLCNKILLIATKRPSQQFLDKINSFLNFWIKSTNSQANLRFLLILFRNCWFGLFVTKQSILLQRQIFFVTKAPEYCEMSFQHRVLLCVQTVSLGSGGT